MKRPKNLELVGSMEVAFKLRFSSIIQLQGRNDYYFGRGALYRLRRHFPKGKNRNKKRQNKSRKIMK